MKNKGDVFEPAPQPVKKVERRPAVKAAGKTPPDLQVEVCRVWNRRVRPACIELKKSCNKAGHLILVVPAGMSGFEPPMVVSEKLSKAAFRRFSTERNTDGYRPAYLPIRYKPAILERPKRRKLLPGHGIPNSVFDPDSRSVFQDTSFPWSTVGRVETELGSFTGTMVGPRHLLTCSHMVNWTVNEAGWVKFTPAYYSGSSPFGIAWAERIICWAQVDGSDGVSDQETAFDYVVAILDRKLEEATGHVGIHTYSPSWNGGAFWQQIGYPGDLTNAQRPVFTSEGAVTSIGERGMSGQTGYVLENFIDTSAGHSGGPYWGWWGEEKFPRVIGVHSTSPDRVNQPSRGNEAGGGPALSSLVAYAREKYA